MEHQNISVFVNSGEANSIKTTGETKFIRDINIEDKALA